MRKYYTDPLKAAWMAREFGVRLGYYQNNGTFVEYEKPITGMDCAWRIIGSGFYLHPENFIIFEPKEGDIAWWKISYDGRCLAKATPLLMKQGSLHSFIERDGKAFFAPEVENA